MHPKYNNSNHVIDIKILIKSLMLSLVLSWGSTLHFLHTGHVWSL